METSIIEKYCNILFSEKGSVLMVQLETTTSLVGMEGISGGGGATVIEDNGCLSQQLLSKKGGWEEEKVQPSVNDCCMLSL